MGFRWDIALLVGLDFVAEFYIAAGPMNLRQALVCLPPKGSS